MARLAIDARGNTRRTVTADGTLWVDVRIGNHVVFILEILQANDKTIDVYKHDGAIATDRTGSYVGRYRI